VKTIDIGKSGGFINLSWLGFTFHADGLGLYFGWFPDLDLTALQITIFEWSGDESHFTLFRFQVLYFLCVLHVDAN
jgi:hypothetical protein